MTLVERALERSKQAAREREAAEKSGSRASAADTHAAMPAATMPPELRSALAPLKIGAAQLRDQRLLPPESLQRRQLIDFRMLRRPILEAADAPVESASPASKRLVMVTSSLP